MFLPKIDTRKCASSRCRILPKILLTNAQSLTSKMDELSLVVNMQKPDLLCLTETWLSSEIGTIYSLCDIPLRVVSSHPYLRVQLQCSLKWDSHIEQISFNANQRLAML